MLHSKFHGIRPTGSEEENFLMVFTINGHDGHLGPFKQTFVPPFHQDSFPYKSICDQI